MTAWTNEELDQISNAEELEIAPRQPNGALRKPLPVWVVRVGDSLYIRSYRGRAGVWFRAVQATHEGRIRVGGVEKDVLFIEETDPAINDHIDAAYRAKYGHSPYVTPMVSAEARATTLRMMPHIRPPGG